jgi:hypothetical protein
MGAMEQHRNGDVAPARLIQLELRDTNQLFNSMDPSPFVDRDLDADAEEFIVRWAQEYSAAEPVTLRIHIERWPAPETLAMIPDAVHNFFAYRAKLNELEFHRLMSEGRRSLLIGLAFLAGCLLIRNIVLARLVGAWPGFIKESLTIAGWVAMWRPMQIYLHDWWPVRRRGRTYQKLSLMPVEVVPKAAPGPR